MYSVVGGVPWSTPGCLATASTTFSSAGSGFWGTTVTSSSGPVKPGPNPFVSMSNATRVGVPDGSVPWSAEPSWREKKGRAMATMMIRATPAESHG